MESIGIITAIIGLYLMWKGGKNIHINEKKGRIFSIAGNILCIPNAIIIGSSNIVLSKVCLIGFIGMTIFHSLMLYKAIKEEKKRAINN